MRKPRPLVTLLRVTYGALLKSEGASWRPEFSGDIIQQTLSSFVPSYCWAKSHKVAGTLLKMGMGAGCTAQFSSVWVIEGAPDVHYCKPLEPLSSPQDFLLAHPPGPYTCLRAVGQRSVAMLDFHLDRLRRSAQASGLLDEVESRQGYESLQQGIPTAIANALLAFSEVNALESGCPECMVTVLLYVQEHSKTRESGVGCEVSGRDISPTSAQEQTATGNFSILVHAWPLPAALMHSREVLGGLEVLVAGEQRSNPETKHSSWLRDRSALDELKAQFAVQEVALTVTLQQKGAPNRRLLLEGLTSNIFIVEEDGAVCTAPTGVLQGSMRERCLAACEHEGIPVRREFPDLARASLWKEAFLTGAGRVLTPISALLTPNIPETVGTGTTARPEIAVDTVSRIELPTPWAIEQVGLSTAGSSDARFKGNDGVIATSGEIQSVARRLRDRMVVDLVDGATHL